MHVCVFTGKSVGCCCSPPPCKQALHCGRAGGDERKKLVSGHSSCGYLSSAQSVVGSCGPDIAHGQSGGLWRHAVRNLEGPD